MQLAHAAFPALLIALAASSSSASDDAISAWLEKPILGASLTQAETVAYCDSRIPRVPPVKSAEEWQEQARKIRERMFSEVIFRGEASA